MWRRMINWLRRKKKADNPAEPPKVNHIHVQVQDTIIGMRRT